MEKFFAERNWRLYCIVWLALLSPALSSADETKQRYVFAIAESSLGSAMAALAEQSNASVLYPHELARTKGMKPVDGEYTVDEAIAILFRDTEFSGSLTASGVIVISRAETADTQTGGEAVKEDSKIRKAIVAGTASIVTAVGTSTDIAAQEPVEAEQPDVIVVTGTRIQDPNHSSSNPISTFTAAQIEATGGLEIAQILQEIPALIGTEQRDPFSSGRRQLNLRNLGAGRTLTLVDGKRFVAGSLGLPAVDVGNIPVSLIERVDVLTGGASAVYGADAVTGVVNFVLKDNFEGVSISGQTGGSSAEWDAQRHNVSIVAGKNFNNDRLNLTGSYTYFKSDALAAVDRSFTNENYAPRIFNETGTGPLNIHVPGARIAGFPDVGARLDIFALLPAPLVLNNAGETFDTNPVGGDGLPYSEFQLRQLRPEAERHIGTLSATFKVNDAFRPYLDVHYATADLVRDGGVDLMSFVNLPLNNPFVPQAVTDAVSVAPIVFASFFSYSQRDLRQTAALEDDTYRVVAGFEGKLSESLRYDVYANIGRNNSKELNTSRFNDRFTASLDAVVDPSTGNIVCGSNLNPSAFFFPAPALSFTPGAQSGCVPFNPFATEQGANSDALRFIYLPTINDVDVKQDVISAYIAGDFRPLGITLPGGDIDYVLGLEYREESGDRFVDPLARTDAALANTTQSNQSGSFSVKEIFGELAVPLLAGRRYADSLTLTGAFRYSDYSTSGGEWTHNAGLTWALNEQIMFRGTYARAVRAPNLGELFRPAVQGSGPTQFDPCDTVSAVPGAPAPVDSGSSTRRANCAEALTAIGIVDPSTYQSSFHFLGFSVESNRDLLPEVADTFTVGFVLEPDFVDGLVVTVDYYDIGITDAIASPDQNFILNQCYDSPTLDNQFCGLVRRSTTPADPFNFNDPDVGEVEFLQVLDLNLAQFDTSGVEMSVIYDISTDNYGEFTFSLAGHYLESIVTQFTPQAASRVDEAYIEGNVTALASKTPKWIANSDVSWRAGNWDSNLGVNYHSRVLRGTNIDRNRIDELTNDPYLDPLWNVQFQLGYQITESTRVYAGGDNLLDRMPDLGTSISPIGPVGRYLYFGVQMNLGSD